MTRHEVKEEMKQAEGDPLVKGRLRAIARARARHRMMAAVPRATVVIANPTHFAVALRYVRGEGGAPLVVAKGADLVALKIREIAERHRRARHRGQSRSRARSTTRSRSIAGFRRSSIMRWRRSCTSSTRETPMPGADRGAVLRKDDGDAEVLAPFERVLGERLKPFLNEVYLINAGLMAAYIFGKRDANIGDILASSAEAFTSPSLLRYAQARGRGGRRAADGGFCPAHGVRPRVTDGALRPGVRQRVRRRRYSRRRPIATRRAMPRKATACFVRALADLRPAAIPELRRCRQPQASMPP